MKALVLTDFQTAPQLSNVAVPKEDSEYDTLIKVVATPIENFDRLAASGKHFTSKYWHPSFPSVPGSSAIGRIVTTGELVYLPAMSMRPRDGAMAEYTVAQAEKLVKIPETIDPAVAVASYSSALTSLMPLKYDIGISPNETVIINGATGFAGKLAVQICRKLGIKNICVSGRNRNKLEELLSRGANQILDINQDDLKLSELDLTDRVVVLDYLWGHPTEKLLQSLVPKTPHNQRQTTLVEIGAATGDDDIQLSASAIRTSGVDIRGLMTANNLSNQKNASDLVWKLLGEQQIAGEISKVSLDEAESVWKHPNRSGERSVITFE